MLIHLIYENVILQTVHILILITLELIYINGRMYYLFYKIGNNFMEMLYISE